MVLSLKHSKELTIKNINDEKHGIIVVDVSSYCEYEKDVESIKKGIETLTLLQSIVGINKFYKDVNSDFVIPTDIFLKVINAEFTKEPFTNAMLKEYFNASIKVEQFYSSIGNFVQMEAYVPFETEFMLFGLSNDKQEDLTKNQINTLHEDYGNLFFDMRNETISVPDFIEASKDLINRITKKNVA